MKYKVFYIFLLCVLNNVHAQMPFQVTLVKDTSWTNQFTGYDICEGVDGDLFAVSTGGFNLGHLHLTKVNPAGIIEWDTLYSFTPFAEFFPKIIPTNDGGVIIGSTSFSYPIPDNDSIKDILLWKIDPNGNIEWQKVLAAVEFVDLVSNKEGDFFILGTQIRKLFDVVVYKLSSNGEVIWEKNYGDPDSFTWSSSIVEIDNEIYFGGRQNKSSGGVKNGFIFKVNNGGDILWELTLERELASENFFLNKIFEFQNQAYFRFDQFYHLNTSTGEFYPVDSNTAFLEHSFEITCNGEELKAINVEPGKYLYRHFDTFGSFTFQKEIINLIGFPKYQCVTADGGFAFLSSNTQKIQITKLDCQGNQDYWHSDCDPPIPEDSESVIYPNPSTNNITIEANFKIESVVIFDAKGSKISIDNLCGCFQQPLDISNLLPGLYFLQIYGEEKLDIQKIIKI